MSHYVVKSLKALAEVSEVLKILSTYQQTTGYSGVNPIKEI